MGPKKELLEKAKKDGAMERIDKVLSLAYLLQSKAYMLYDEADDLLRSYGLLIGETKMLHNRLCKAFDEYFKDFSKMIDNQTAKNNYFTDVDSFSRFVHSWAELPEKFEPYNKEEKA